MSKMYRTIILVLFTISVVSNSQAQTIKIATYNLLTYSDVIYYPNISLNVNRLPLYRSIMDEVDPDILVVEEIYSQSDVNEFLDDVLNFYGNEYDKGTFIYDNSFGNLGRAIFYKKQLFDFVSNTPIPTQLRDINDFTLRYKPTNEVFKVFAVHLDAGFDDAAKRGKEVQKLRAYTNNLASDSPFIICGDFNIYSSNEIAYQRLVENTSGNEGHFIDIFASVTGTWNKSFYAQHHTQSTRYSSLGEGSGGGLDDRFDMILFSKGISDGNIMEYVPNSYEILGNDAAHYNSSVNWQGNSSVPSSIADALYYASDHLPVSASFKFNNLVNIDGIESSFFRVYPNPTEGLLQIDIDENFSKSNSTNLNLQLINMLGQVVYSTQIAASQTEHSIVLPNNLHNGSYILRLIDKNGSIAEEMLGVY